jgi:hypothetical protein
MAERIYSAAQPGAVYSEAVVAGSYTVITASEVTAGGGSMGRPVAVITIGPEGVTVKPVVDATKIALAAVTAWAAVAAAAIRLTKRGHGR